MGSSGYCSDIFVADSHAMNETAVEGHVSKNLSCSNRLNVSRSWQQSGRKSNKPIELLRRVCGNDRCADCNAPEPDWASLNLGVLICIECSGVHRNLGVHISKVRSLTLDVKVWEPSVLNLFQSIGNTYANSIWEEVPQLRSGTIDDVPGGLSKSDRHKEFLIKKPSHDDPISVKEKFINSKYAEKKFVLKIKDNQHLRGRQLWESVCANDKRAVYRYIVCSEADVNDHRRDFFGDSLDKFSSSCVSSVNKSKDQLMNECYDGCSLLHLACLNPDVGMVELLLQYGANVNASDSRGRTPLHYCVVSRRTEIVKLLLMRGANRQAADKEGITAYQLASESALDDSDVFALLKETNR